MTFPGTAIISVGERPRHSVVIPSFRAILRKPSTVELIVRFSTSATAQFSAAARSLREDDAGPVAADAVREASATQYGALLFTQKTSLQQDVTPSSGGRFAKERGYGKVGLGRDGAAAVVGCCDCSLTRTTSRGVTGIRVLAECFEQNLGAHCSYLVKK